MDRIYNCCNLQDCCVWLDVYVKDDKEVVYDIEMQVSDTKELPKRSRYYQSMMDLQLIDKRQFYAELNQSYVIFICAFDVFGKGRHIYTFENICKEDKSILMGDEAVKEAKKNREWRHEYMTLLMRDQENQKIGEKRGEKRGEEKMIVNALKTTKSIKQTSLILQLSEQEVRKIAEEKNLLIND